LAIEQLFSILTTQGHLRIERAGHKEETTAPPLAKRAIF